MRYKVRAGERSTERVTMIYYPTEEERQKLVLLSAKLRISWSECVRAMINTSDLGILKQEIDESNGEEYYDG